MRRHTFRPNPPEIPGFCTTCGYDHTDELCAIYPCYRCIHRVDAPPMGPDGSMTIPPPPYPRRDDGSPGYTPAEYLECPCACHDVWRVAFANAIARGAKAIVTTQSEIRKRKAAESLVRVEEYVDNEEDWE